MKIHIKSSLCAIAILCFSFIASLLIHNYFNASALIPSIFVLAVFLISLITDGYFYGIISALVSVLAVNFAFTFPFFEFNFTIHENAVSAIIMLVITTITCALTNKIKKQESMRAESEMEKMRANLLRAVSHDLRTPLTAIYGASSTITENYDAVTDDHKKQMLAGIQEDSLWLIRMVENLLSVTRFDRSSVALIKSPVVLEELIDSVLSKFAKRYGDTKVELDIPDDFVMVSADAILIEQVLINLLENAVQHAKGMMRLLLRVYIEQDNAIFEVTDDGCGIEKEALKNIFSGYSSPKEVPADSHKHCMGIGLSVCDAIIRAHGGTISACRIKPHGMTFRFNLETEEDLYE